LDIKENFLTCPFASSLLGSRLERWLRLLDLPQVQVLWEKNRRTTSYQWILSSWSLLSIFQKWIATVKWLASRGFANVQDTHTQHYRVIADGSLSSAGPNGRPILLNPTLEAFDTSFHDTWAHQIIIHNDPIWTNPPPPDQFRQATPIYCPPPIPTSCPLPPAQPAPHRSSNPPTGALKRPREPDFTSSQALFEPVIAFQPGQRPMAYMIHNTDRATQYPRLADTPGKDPCLICFRSSFPPPFNVCHTGSCIGNRSRRRETKRLHIDLAQEPWRTKPEAFWQPVVEWLQLPTIRPFVRPTAALRRLTPSTRWS
jgi:hypothetical protein